MVFANVPEGAVFVPRMRKGMQFTLTERNKADLESGITSDHVIEMGSGNGKVTLREIGYYDSATYKHYVFFDKLLEILSN